MAGFIEKQQRYAFNTAAQIKGEIYSEPCHLPFEDAFYMDEDVLKIGIKPQYFTLLHDYISYRLKDDFDYCLKKVGSEIYEEIYNEFDSFNANYVRYEDFSGNDYRGYLNEIYSTYVHEPLVRSTFDILYNDRSTMRAFSEKIAAKIQELKVVDYPLYLLRDGVMIRFSRWPVWLKRALLKRESGSCAICQRDLTGVFANNAETAVDHLVPLNMGGTNDPTNLQLLCKECNADKGGDKTTSSDRYPTFWDWK